MPMKYFTPPIVIPAAILLVVLVMAFLRFHA